MKNVNAKPTLTRTLIKGGAFEGHPFRLVDVGARAGYSHQWNHLGKAAEVLGFEPDREECARLNAAEHEVRFRCLPIALDSRRRQRPFFINTMNTAGSGFFPARSRMGLRFSPGPAAVDPATYRKSQEAAPPRPIQALLMDTDSFDAVAAEEEIKSVDFFKIDAEGAELDILEGAESFLSGNGALGLEVEVSFMPIRQCPLFYEIYNHLALRGYLLYDLDAFHYSRGALPTPVAWDHRNHEGKRILGPTIAGQLGHGDALFFRDLIDERFAPSSDADWRRVLKAACLFDLYGLTDCAVELLVYYWDGLEGRLGLTLEKVLDAAVPAPHTGRMSHAEYTRLYAETVGRMDV
ncbi:FkbM family methyltransferase [Azospirillum sp. RWY-5-1]|uniref:FkbM family methyltransferase n=1 Tax=Azospirillum oleiclasticum TaxID=2735135 RepID=A0ABX2TLE3_9PROT|nr:FkbM family methyltransferase [Azospirillum oleiclasticum]NYZ18040.1 FkbM family methyltransferase [Azospirillum oleiclasticum]NYZ25185.1 FkbM family methyltransferase [Azospirillum oleiclasticum]